MLGEQFILITWSTESWYYLVTLTAITCMQDTFVRTRTRPNARDDRVNKAITPTEA